MRGSDSELSAAYWARMRGTYAPSLVRMAKFYYDDTDDDTDDDVVEERNITEIGVPDGRTGQTKDPLSRQHSVDIEESPTTQETPLHAPDAMDFRIVYMMVLGVVAYFRHQTWRRGTTHML